jgi:hypothetical protein
MGILAGGDMGVWGLSWASDVVSLEAGMAMEPLVLPEEAAAQKGKASPIEFSA